MLTTPIFTRLMSTAEYGQYNVFNSWLGIITIFATLNLYYGVYTQGLVKFQDEQKVYSSSLQGLTTTLVLLWAIIYFIFHDFWNKLFDLSTVQMTAMIVMIWTTAVFNFWAAEQRVLYKYKILVTLTVCVSLAKPIVGVLFVINANDKVTARILGLVLVELIGYILLYFIQMIRGKKFFCAKFWCHALLFNIPLIPHYLSQIVLNSADRLMISNMIGDSEAGIYSLAYSLAYVMTLFNVALSQTLNPWIYQKIRARKIGEIAPVAYKTLFLISAVNILLILIAPEIVSLFAPPAYYDAIWVIPPVAMSAYFMYSYDLFAKFAFYYEKTNFIMFASVIGAVLNIILNYIFINKFGYQAAGYTSLFCYIVYCIGHYTFMNKVCDKFCNGIRPYNTILILKITISFLAMGFGASLTYYCKLIRYMLIVIVLWGAIVKRKQLIDIIKQNYNFYC